MKTLLKHFLTSISCVALMAVTSHAQPPGMGGPPSPKFGNDFSKVFGDNKAFSANLEFKVSRANGADPTMIPGKMEYLDGKTRFEMNIGEISSSKMKPEAAAQIKAMHMDKMVMISRPDKKVSYLVYTGMNGYVETPMSDEKATKPASDFKMESSKLGEESYDGHECVKNKVVITDDKGEAHEMTVWNAKDMKNFPVKIQDAANSYEMAFKDVKLEKPDAGQFEPPADMTKYNDMREMIMSGMMKNMQH